MNTNVVMDDRLVVRQYAGAFLEKMLGELAAGNEKGVEHVFRNLGLFLSPPVTALDGGGVPLARLRESLAPGVVERFDALSLKGALHDSRMRFSLKFCSRGNRHTIPVGF